VNVGTVVPFSELRNLRLKRLRDAIGAVCGRLKKEPLHAGGPHPLYLEFGRLLYEASTRDFKPCEIPKPLRARPWIFVLAELDRAFPDCDWVEEAMNEHVQRYLATLAASEPPTIAVAAPAPFPPEYAHLVASTAPARKIGGTR
jgi:hypothetical protein